MPITLTKGDLANLSGVHPDLVKVIKRAAQLTTIPFKVMEGLRSIKQQEQNIANGVSWTMNSRHLTGHAIDVVPMVDVNKDGKVSTAEMYSWPVYYKLAPIIKQAAKDVGVPVEWGGDWKKNKDGPHWQLPWKQYPAKAAGKTAPKLAEIQATQPPVTEETEAQSDTKQAIVTGTITTLSTSGAFGVLSFIQSPWALGAFVVLVGIAAFFGYRFAKKQGWL